jgi:hypothetical protein
MYMLSVGDSSRLEGSTGRWRGTASLEDSMLLLHCMDWGSSIAERSYPRSNRKEKELATTS